ncbi:MAG TPA: 16S rRNA (guanine(527)-N(7))-methyltransferase RsmG [Natronosporangium sp.]|nr:16S rRNA (guanine(527)-N(7))-methyltransferase RsmG [Natronosporangium sp.]
MGAGDRAVRLAGQPEPVRVAAEVLFGSRLPVAERYADRLTGDGVVRGLLGPREAPRVWQRHLLNCAAVAELIPDGATVTDVGSGAGLPGIPLALARPDLRVTLIEPMQRRTDFLTETVEELGIGERVTVWRGRAEEAVGVVPGAEVVTARALAPLDRLAAWCLPLAVIGGRVLAIKGESAAREIEDHTSTVVSLGGGEPVLRRCGTGLLESPSLVVEIVRVRRAARGGVRRMRDRRDRRGRR